MRAVYRSCMVIVASLALITTPVVSSAEDVDQLIQSMDELSQQTSAKNEEVKHLEDEIRVAEGEMVSLQETADQATSHADEVKAQESGFQGEVNRIASAKYRGVVLDPVTQVIGSNNPQNAIDRSAYIATLTSKTENVVEKLLDATAEANESRNEALQAVEAAQFKRNSLVAKKDQLAREQEDLKVKIEEIVSKVDSLSDADRARWVAKNGPVEFAIAGITGSNPIGLAALQAGMTKIGAPYGWGATGPDQFDCSGLIVWSYQQQGKTVPRTSQAQMAGGTPVSRSELQPGDIVGFYPGATHVGIYAGDNKILHASDYGIPVQVVSMDSMPFYGARRY